MGRRPFGRVPPQHVRHEADGLRRGVGYQGGQGGGRELRELEVHGGRQLEPLGPVPLVGRPNDRADFEHLVDFRVAGKERPERVQLGHDATHGPDVYRASKILVLVMQ